MLAQGKHEVKTLTSPLTGAARSGYSLGRERKSRMAKKPTKAEIRRAAAALLGSLGASKGGHARARALTKARRRAIAKKASAARWGKKGRAA